MGIDFEKILFHRLEKLRQTLCLDHQAWSELLQLSKRNYNRSYPKGRLPLRSLAVLCESLNLSLNSIRDGGFDFPTVAAHFNGNLTYVPEKYTIAAYSKKRTLLNILDYVENLYGFQFRLSLLHEFQLTEAALANPNETINIRLMSEVFARIGQMGFTTETLVSMGTHSIINSRMHFLKKYVEKARTPSEVYDELINRYSGFFDRNCQYKIAKLATDSVIMTSQPEEEIKSLLKMTRLGNKYACDFKGGVVSAFPTLLGLPAASVQEVSCIHQGDSMCRYSLNFEYAHAVARKRYFH